MADITLTAAVRTSLLNLSETSSLLNRTQERLTTGKKVNSAIDDAISYFSSKSLSDRASDFSVRKDEIDQGISSVKAAVNGTDIADTILKQMKGIVNSARSADATQRAALTTQFNDLAKQLNSAVSDASYQGLNLVDNTAAKLTVYFSQGTAASLDVTATNLKASAVLTVGNAVSLGTISAMLITAGAAGAAGFSSLSNVASIAGSVLDNVAAQIDNAISTVRSAATKLGGNVTLLQTRLDFTTSYANTLTEGSDKLTLADLNEEGANLVALQTRQQIGIQTLSLAGQQSQAILSLLR